MSEVAIARERVGFRLDINALRAWAVFVVVGYHFNLIGFESGFVGVDIFFVLSGYLITGQVLLQLENNKFSFSRFWTARLRRIYPALCMVILGTLVLGWFLTMPSEFFRHVRQSLSSLAFGSNITFSGERGYFDSAAHTKPLLHTWSLSIEWQFYLVLPFVLFAIWRISPVKKKKLCTLAALTALTGASMAWCFWTSNLEGGADFFSLRARAWELLIGSVVASMHQMRTLEYVLLKIPKSRKTVCKNIQAFFVSAGWMMVFLSSVLGDAKHWPGLMTLLPVLGAAMIVFAGADDGAIFKNVTHSFPVQSLGDASYSIYLWHWPLWVFAQQWASYSGVSISSIDKLGLGVLTVGLSYLSLRFIEQPVRVGHVVWSTKRLWCFYGFSLLVLALFTLLAVKTRGFPQRIPDYQQRAELVRNTNTPRDECFRNSNAEKKAQPQFCEFGIQSAKSVSGVILWGDSLANQYLEPISKSATSIGLHGLIATQSACRAMLIEKAGDSGISVGCDRFNQEVLGVLVNHSQPSIVVLARNWGGAESVTEVFTLIRRLLAAGKTVVLILPLPNPGFDVPERWIREQFKAGKAVNDLRIPATPQLLQQEARDAISLQSKEFASNPKLLMLDLTPNICDSHYCYLVRDGQANFRDTLHISNVNAGQYEDAFSKILEKAVNVATLPQSVFGNVAQNQRK
jgi:peptidoglycan/LPS O-acetylase OafA/YrhL